MGKVISLINQKGGVGKTTSSVNLASALALRNYKTLVIDMDPQANASQALGSNPDYPGIFHVLSGKEDIQKSIQPSTLDTLFLISSNEDLSGLGSVLNQEENWETFLKLEVQKIKDQFDFIFIDCPPSLGPLTINVLTASDRFIVPLQCEYYALEGLGGLLETVKRVKDRLNPSLKFQGILLTMFDSRNKLSKQVEAEIREHFENKVFQTIVPRNVRLSEAPSFGQSIFQYDPKSQGARSYYNLSAEFEKQISA